KHAVLELSLSLVAVDARGQGNAAMEGAVADFAPVVLTLRLLGLLFMLAADGQDVVLDGDFDLVRIDPGKGGLHDDIVIALREFERKRSFLLAWQESPGTRKTLIE